MKIRKPLKPSGKPIARRNAARKTYLKHSTKRIRSVNPKAQAKRKIGYRKMLASKEYRSARAEAMERAQGMCEFTTRFRRGVVGSFLFRCGQPEALHAHHLSYPKSRPLEASDLLIVCKYHHEYLESQKIGKTRMF